MDARRRFRSVSLTVTQVLHTSHLELAMQPTRSRLNVASRLATVTEAQAGYFTRAQAAANGVADFELERATDYE